MASSSEEVVQSPGYVALQVTTNFTFLEGASHPEEYVEKAAALGLSAVAITDRNSLAGVVRAHVAAKQHGVRLLVGAELALTDGQRLIALPEDREAYGRLCRLITTGRRRAEKGQCTLHPDDVKAFGAGQIFIVLVPWEAGNTIGKETEIQVRGWAEEFPGSVYLALKRSSNGDEDLQSAKMHALSERCQVPLVAAPAIRMHDPSRRMLADVLTCISKKCRLNELGLQATKHAQQSLKTPSDMAALYRDCPEVLSRTHSIAGRISFDLDQIRFNYPREVSRGESPQKTLEDLVRKGMVDRYPLGCSQSVHDLAQRELNVIGELGYASYFLTVQDIVSFARDRGILCQGRGSAGNSVVCFLLGITSVSPEHMDMVFERFVSSARDEPPDIDVDFEHERREEVIQYIYNKYGRERTALACTVIHYRARSAVRDVGKVFGFSEDVTGGLAAGVWGGSGSAFNRERVREAGFNPDDPRFAMMLALTAELIGFPRHLSQHVGGFILSDDRLDEIVPIENALMDDRTVISWDKDDLDAMGILKIDVLSLGMLSCIRRAFALLVRHGGPRFDLSSVPSGDRKVYEMLSRGDSLGVFQVESRAQMSFLPRMKPKCFYDLVIEVAIVRPGPIQGDMVHPYLRRRNGEEKVNYPSAALQDVLKRTLGVPLFQEQAMRVATVAAGFSLLESDQLRRAMATFRRTGTIQNFRDKFIAGATSRGYDRQFAEQCFRQIEGFGEYGFPESHAISFALLVYVSAYLKCHHPAVFACALLNAQPMGFYAPAQIVRDAREHGVEVFPADVNLSEWDASLEPGSQGLALRLGLRQVQGLSEDEGQWIVAARGNGYQELDDLWRCAGVSRSVLKRLAKADALTSLKTDRRSALWQASALPASDPLPLFSIASEPEFGYEKPVQLRPLTQGQNVSQDYATTRLSLRAHPIAILRDGLKGCQSVDFLKGSSHGDRISVAGLVLVRQRPGTAKGVVFVTIEDEFGVANIVIWQRVFEHHRRIVMGSRLMQVAGKVQREGQVIHVVASRLEDLSERLDWLEQDDPESPTGSASMSRQKAVQWHHPRHWDRRVFPSRDFH